MFDKIAYTQKLFNRNKIHKKFIKYQPNQLKRILKTFSYREWSLWSLANNPNITVKDITNVLTTSINDFWDEDNDDEIDNYDDYTPVFEHLCINPGISLEEIVREIQTNLHFLGIDRTVLYQRIDITVEALKELDIPLDWGKLSDKPSIKLSFIKENITFPWNWNSLSSNPNINIVFVKEHLDKEWNWNELSRNDGIRFQDVLDNLDLPWNYEYLSKNLNISVSDAIQLPEKKWLWRNLCMTGSRKLTLQYIKDNPDFPWDWKGLSYNYIITLDFIKENLDKKWNWPLLTAHRNITVKDIFDNPTLPWDIKYIFNNPNFTMKDLDRYPIIDKNVFLLSRQSSLTRKDVVDNLRDFSIEYLESNMFLYNLKYCRETLIKVLNHRRRKVPHFKRMVNWY